MKSKTLFITLLFLLLHTKGFSHARSHNYFSSKNNNKLERYSFSETQIFSKSSADSSKYPNPTFTLQVGAFLANSHSSLRVNSENASNGSEIDLEKDLAFNSKNYLPRADLIFRLCKRHQLVVGYFIFNKNRTTTLERTIQYSDTSFYANTSVNGKVRFSFLNADYRFSIIRKPAWEFGISAGAKLINVYSRFSAELNQLGYSRSKSNHTILPIPGIHASVYLGKHILIRAIAEYLTVSRGNWNFRICQIRPTVEIYPFEHVGLGLAYDYLNTQIIKVPSGSFDGDFKVKFNAVSLFASFRF